MDYLHQSNLWSSCIIQTPATEVFCPHKVFATRLKFPPGLRSVLYLVFTYNK